MTNDAVAPAIQAHNERPASIWNSAGAGYEGISRGIADSIEHAVLRLNPEQDERVLDIATGTGWAARLVARRGARVVGIDLGAELIEAAEERARTEGLDITYDVGDAEALPFGDGTFDAAISTCGIMFATRPEAAASELARVIRRGGRVVLTTWRPDSNVFEMFKVMKAYMPTAPDPAPPSPFEWGREERVSELLGEAFDLTFEDGVSFYREPDGEAAWAMFSQNYGPTKALAGSLDTGRRDELHNDFVAFHDRFRTELGISVPRTYLLTYGVRN
ncbi:methyltransferase domain-containing protein [Pararhizobium mangrovi]|uniref:Methyltransferase domain-containing protein n=1 Tax=Pararhizobium mangrovi TaxID=2590452 RepID=A0A506U078_9HYPH|nr:methyltransferase domain-containing protein [Pararhizobium mangrovi]TPW26611.1 methyltransferase domain-containing protein [Pararhizobium mangrovi]